MNRRTFLGAAAIGSLGSGLGSAAAPSLPQTIIDTHIHLFDISRTQGVPWPAKNSTIYRSALPARYRQLAAPHGVTGAIAIECSPWFEDNQWVLNVAADAPMIVGTVGNLAPGTSEFRTRLERLHRYPLFRGIRYGNLWGNDLGVDLSRPGFMDDLKRLAAADLVLDTANPNPALIRAVVRVTDQVPDLRVIIDHFPSLTPPRDSSARNALEANLRLIAGRPRVFAKVSGIVRRVDGRVPLDVNFYRDRLDHLWETFGAERLMYGSDWPNSELAASYAEVFQLTRDFLSSKDRVSIEKVYWQNSLKVYRWAQRTSAAEQGKEIK